MRHLISEVREAFPFGAPQTHICVGACQGCSMKLLDFLESELLDWEGRLDRGEKPGLAELSGLLKTTRRVHRVLKKNGLVALD